ncbi:MAG TPA: hypothetical protein ENH28_03385, partial [Euryarchaeota archaeon]|nr:hypothetical protein [Euryarchaeota archaeon]
MFQRILRVLVISMVVSLTLLGTSIVHSQEKYKGLFEFGKESPNKETPVTQLQTGNQVIEQVNAIEGG